MLSPGHPIETAAISGPRPAVGRNSAYHAVAAACAYAHDAACAPRSSSSASKRGEAAARAPQNAAAAVPATSAGRRPKRSSKAAEASEPTTQPAGKADAK